jgi:two-component system chemotaxis response regulator CheY/two-component system response regulator MprA
MKRVRLSGAWRGPESPRGGAADATSIVLAEAGDGLRRALAIELSHLGCEVAEAADGRAAIDILARFLVLEREPHLIVAAMGLPGCGGLTLLDLVRRMEWSTPFVLLTSLADAEVGAKALRMGATAVLPVREGSKVSELCSFIRGVATRGGASPAGDGPA